MEKAKLRPEKRFEANSLEFFKIKISRNFPEKTLISNFFQFCQNVLKTKISLEVHFKKADFTEFFYFFPHREKTKLSKLVQLTILLKKPM